MNEWIGELLDGYLPTATIEKLRDDFDTYSDVPLVQLGLDSLATMALVIRLEERFGKRIDYATFDVSTIETIAEIRSYLNRP